MNYIIEMADMGFGLSRQDVMCLAFQLAEKVACLIHLRITQLAVGSSMCFVVGIQI